MRTVTVVFFSLACSSGPGDSARPGQSGNQLDDSESTPPGDSGGDDSATADRDEDGWVEPDDCDDDNATVYPGAMEVCVDHLDNDCDGVADHCDHQLEAVSIQRFVDPDADGWETDGNGGFGSFMGFLATGGDARLWISPQFSAVEPAWRSVTIADWTSATIALPKGPLELHGFASVETRGDFDGDGSPDLVVAHSTEDRSTAYLFEDPVTESQSVGDASSWVTALGVWDGTTSPAVYALGDITSNGFDDLLLSGNTGSWVVEGPITGAVDVSDGAASTPAYVSGVRTATALDFDGDGLRDLATANSLDETAGPSAGAAYVYLEPSAGVFEPAVADHAWYGTSDPMGENAGTEIQTGDFDGDGRDDLVVRSLGHCCSADAAGIEYVVDHEAANFGELSSVARARITGQPADHIGNTRGTVADFDHDLRTDVVVSSVQNAPDADGNGYVAVLLGPFDGHLTADGDANLILRGDEDDEWCIGLCTVNGDLDGDGELEVAISSAVLDGVGSRTYVVDIVTPALLFGP